MSTTPNPEDAMTAVAERNGNRMPTSNAVELALVAGDLAKLTTEQRLDYYSRTCDSLGLNPLTRPFDYLNLNGKLTLYARKDCTEQLRTVRKISVRIQSREVVEGCYVVTAKASTPDGREDESIGAVPIEGLKGEGRSNAMMKAETKAKRRVTLSICGLGMLDETEIDSIPQAHPAPPVVQTQQAIAHDSIDVDSIIAEHAKLIEEAETIEELKMAWKLAFQDKRLSIEEKEELAGLKDERKSALTQQDLSALKA